MTQTPMLVDRLIDRRSVLRRGGTIGAATLAAPYVFSRLARAAGNQVLFLSEESNKGAIAVYDKINADFEQQTGIKVVMEYPGFANIAQRVATLIAAGTPPEVTWYGAASAMPVALQDQLADVSDVVRELNVPDNLRLVYKGADRSIPTSQQFLYGWYRSDSYEKAGLAAPPKTWEEYQAAAQKLNAPPDYYGCVIPSAHTGATHLLVQQFFDANDVHWFKWDANRKAYALAIDEGDNKKRAIEVLDYLRELHRFSPEASDYDYGQLMDSFVTGKVANAYYIGARLLNQVIDNNSKLESLTKPMRMPPRRTDKYFLSIQGFHINQNANVDAAKKYCRFFLTHPAYIEWLHSVPLHIVPSRREVLNSAEYKNNPIIQRHGDVLALLNDMWGQGVPDYYADGPEINPLVGLYSTDNLGGLMLALHNVQKMSAGDAIDQVAEQVRKKMKRQG
jgi:multiple sugar transport system substrate-binding protein